MLKDTIASKEEIVKVKEEMVKAKDEIVKILTNELESYKSLVNGAGGIVEQTMSVISYLTKNYNNAPPLVKFENCAKIKDKDNVNDYIENLCYYHKNDLLIQHISQCIIAEYKTKDPSKQSLWSSDTSRITYIIKELIKDNTDNWLFDKKGIKVCNYIINPLLTYIREELSSYIRNIDINDRNVDLEKQTEILMIANAVIHSIDNNTLKHNILRVITPEFYCNKKLLKG